MFFSAMKRLDLQLLAAAKKGDAEKILALLAAGANQNIANFNGTSPIMRAVQNRYTEKAGRINNAVENPIKKAARQRAAFQRKKTARA